MSQIKIQIPQYKTSIKRMGRAAILQLLHQINSLIVRYLVLTALHQKTRVKPI